MPDSIEMGGPHLPAGKVGFSALSVPLLLSGIPDDDSARAGID